MGTVNWTVSNYAADDNKNISGTTDRSSGAFSTSGAASNITGLSAGVGEVVHLGSDTSHWVRFGGRVAAVGSGFHLSGGSRINWEVSPGDEGPISIIEG